MNGTKFCSSCIWADQCGQEELCDDYSPTDDSEDFTYYRTVLDENAAEYEELMAEMEA